MGLSFRLETRSLAALLSLSLLIPSPALAQELRDALVHSGALPVPVPTRAAAPQKAASAADAGVEGAFHDLAFALEHPESMTVGAVLARSGRLAVLAEGNARAQAWIAANLEQPLVGLSEKAFLKPDTLEAARRDLERLRVLLGLRAPVEPRAGRDSKALREAGAKLSDKLAGIPADKLYEASLFSASAVPVPPTQAKAPAVPAADPALEELRRTREELELQDKLAQKGDLAGPGHAEELKVLDAMIKHYEGILASGSAPGLSDSEQMKWASLETLRNLFGDLGKAPGQVVTRPPPLAGTKLESDVEKAVGKIEALKAEVQGQVAMRDAAAAMLAVADRARDAALRERRDGKDVLEFRKNFARLAMVMDLSYSLNLLNSAEQALGGMDALLDAKLKKIDKQRKDNEAHGGQAGQTAGQAAQWLAEANAAVEKDKTRAKDFDSLSKKSGVFAQRIVEFKDSVSALLASIDARDRGKSPTASAEYDRRVALLPEIHQKLIHGAGGSGVAELSLDYLREQSAEIGGYARLAADADAKIASVPVEFAGALVVAVPGIPAVSLPNAQAPELLAMLADRRAYWTAEKKTHQDSLDSVLRSLDASNSKRVLNDFGDSVPESLTVYRAEQRALAQKVTRASDDIAGKIDALAALIEAGVPGASLPRLSGQDAAQLRESLPLYLERLDALTFPDNDPGYDAKMNKLSLVKLIPFIADLTVRRVEAEATVKALDKPIEEILPEARARFGEALAVMQAILDDVDADAAYVNGGFSPAGQALIDRKRALVTGLLRPMLERMQVFIDQVLIPFQLERIAQADPAAQGDSLGVLYKEKKSLFERISESLTVTLPWGLASGGAKAGDVGTARANIEATRVSFLDYKALIVDYKDQMRRRKDPNNTEMEDVYGEQAPYSLVRRAAVYRAEKAQRAPQFNARAAQVMQILKEMDQLSQNRYNLAARYVLPTDIQGEGAASVAKLKSLADNKVLQGMASDIQRIAEEAQAAAGQTSLGIGSSGGTGIPTGTQPPLALADAQKLALLGLEAVKRLVPTTATGGAGDSLAETLARYLFSDALVVSSDSNLAVRIPLFEGFLDRGGVVLEEALADLDADLVYVGSDLSGGTAVLARKILVYNRIRDAAKEGAELFEQKAGWSAEGIQTAADAQGYYDSLGEVYSSGNEALDAEAKAAQQMKDALKEAANKLREQKATVLGWLKQLNDPHESALNRVAQNISTIQDKTRAVLETNVDRHEAEAKFKEAESLIMATVRALEGEQAGLSKLLGQVGDLDRLSPVLARRVTAVSGGGSTWLAAAPGGPQTLVIPKSGFSNFLSQLFSTFEPESASRDLAALQAEILKNPMALAQLLPGSKMVEVGQGADGFYLVYQTEFSTPYGLESSNQVTMGNVLKLWGNNVSVIGHRFASPPDPVNAPFGDQGITVRVESLQGSNFVNYLDVTFHKFIQDIPGDLTVGSQAKEARMMVFDDFALLLANGKLYFGAAGFADFAVDGSKDKPYYYGGNLKSSVKFTEVVSLNAEESLLFAKDPRKFMQTVNLDFTKYDPDLDKDFVIGAEGENKTFRRDKLGVGFDLQKALETKESFKLDFYFSRVTGTDDIEQNAVGATVLKGFAFDVGSVPVETTVSGTGELGEKYNTFAGRVSFNLPKQGLVISAQGKMLGDAETYFLEARKKLGANTEAFVSYGSPYVGLNHRLTLGANTTFTLGELWRAVAGGAANSLQGGETLLEFNKRLDEFFKKDEPNEALIKELQKVFNADVGKKLLTLSVGTLTKDLKELQKAGALLDNTRQRAMIGFVTNPVGGQTAERATGGGFQIGSQTELTMTKSQKALMERKVVAIYEAGLQLQLRLLELTKLWQSTLGEILLARWDLALASFVYGNADEPVLKASAQAQALEAKGRFRQAALRYNALTGRGPDEALPFDSVSPAEMDSLLDVLRKTLERPDRLAELYTDLGRLSSPEAGFNLMDWIPWVERLTFTLGVQLQDVLSNQVIGAGVSVRLPVYDPTSKAADRSLRLGSLAVIKEMAGLDRATRLRARSEQLAAQSWEGQAALQAGRAKEVCGQVAEAIKAYRNGLMSQGELWDRFHRWQWSVTSHLTARVQAGLKGAWAVLDAGAQDSNPWGREESSFGPAPKDLGAALQSALSSSESLEALALRSEAAAELVEASSHRFSKISVDLNLGVNLTAAGVALLPVMGWTALSVYPIINIALNPSELKELSVKRHESERDLYTQLGSKVSSDLALQLFSNYTQLKSAQESLEIYARQIIPELEAAQDGSARKAWELDAARGDQRELLGRLRQTKATLNYLMGRPLDAPVELSEGLDASFARLSAQLAEQNPLAAGRDVLASRLSVARSVETVVDKNLKTQDIRLEPISLIGRALGRLVSALGGDGLASPELAALARHQVLQAERDLKSYDESLPVLRARLAFELAQSTRELAALSADDSGRGRLTKVGLRNKIYGLNALLLAYGGTPPAPGEGAALPWSYAQLRERLQNAFSAETGSPELGRLSEAMPGEPIIEAQGNLRYTNLKQSLGQEPIGKQFIEGWVEVRLRSAATPPEALIALAKLQEEKADQLYQNELALSRAHADMLLSRLLLDAGLWRWARGTPQEPELRRKLDVDLTLVAAHLKLPTAMDPDALLALLPASAGSEDVESAAQRYLSEVAALDLDLLKRTLFQEGLPEELAAARDPLPQLRSNLIAERMSYKGFTPVAAFGMFRGVWVGAAFLEAPDPERIQRNLENILTDGLKRELEAQDRLKSLALKLHSLMASVADKSQALEALRLRLQAARRNLSGVAVRADLGMASPQDVRAAQREASAAHDDFVATLSALRADFVHLVTELQALGYQGPAWTGGREIVLRQAPSTSERDARAELLAWWSQRLLDDGFEARQEELLKGAPESLRVELKKRLLEYRRAYRDAESVLHVDFTAAERLDLLMRNDLQGRRQAVEGALSRILDELSAADPSRSAQWTGLMDFLNKDVAASAQGASGDLVRAGELRSALRTAYWAAVPAPPVVEEAYQRLSDLSDKMSLSRQDALQHFLQQKMRPQDYVLRDAALDEYVKALVAYDEEMVRAFALPEVSQDPRWARALDGVFGLRASLARRRDLLRYGRGMLSLDAAVELGEARLRALQWETKDHRELAPASETLAFLKAMKKRWAGAPDEIDSLLAVRPAVSGGRMEWLTEKDLGSLKSQERLVEREGKTWLMPEKWRGEAPSTEKALREAGAREVVAGADVRRDRLKRAERQAETLSRQAETKAALAAAPFVLTRDFLRGPGRMTRVLDLPELRRLESQGRVLYFSTILDHRTGLRLPVHPLAARWKDPAELVILVQAAGTTFPSGRFGSLEALLESTSAADFERLELGRVGVTALLEESRREEAASKRAGWLSLKLEGFAYALDKDGVLAAVYMDEKELKAARKKAEVADDVSHAWAFHSVSDLRIGLDSTGLVVAAEGRGFALRFGETVVQWWLVEPLLALETDGRGRVLRWFTDAKELEREAGTWWLEDTEGRVWRRTDKDISPIHRLRRYIDPVTGLPVALGRSYLARRLDEAEDELGDVGRWAYMPWNWGEILLETPRGIIKTPIEMITGRDPNQEGYIGRVYMYQTYGGETERRGVLGSIVHAIDIFEILPDPVGRYMDPSQFPARVDNRKGPILPGEWEHEKKPKTTDGDRDVHFGKGALLREVRYAKEDREDARARIMGSFQGGVRRTFVETVRGRAGQYGETTLDHAVGRTAVEETLRRVGDRVSSEGEGRLSAVPGHIAVDEVSAVVELQLGAEQQGRRIKVYEEFLRREGLETAAAPSPDTDAARRGLLDSETARRALQEAVKASAPQPGLPGFPALPRLFARL